MSENCNHDCSSCSQSCESRDPKSFLEKPHEKSTIRKVIGVVSGKGGVGKTTTAINLSACLAEKGKRVLTIDMDPQGNTTSGLGIDKSTVEHTSYQLLTNETTIWEAMTPSIVPGLSVIASERSLAGAEIELIGVEDREFILKKEVDKVRDNYDFVIIDCPPSLNTLTVNAMTTADTVLVPIQCEYYALEAVSYTHLTLPTSDLV